MESESEPGSESASEEEAPSPITEHLLTGANACSDGTEAEAGTGAGPFSDRWLRL